ncbi:MAG: hypothetical protein ACRERU_11875 [Methylococcales bacterium]
MLSYAGNGFLSIATDQFGRALLLDTDIDSITGRPYRLTITDPAGQITRYYWDNATDSGPTSSQVKTYDLTKVIFADNGERAFQYSESDRIVVPHGVNGNWTFNLLTGIIDELGVLSSSYTYNYDGRILTPEIAKGVFRFSFAPPPFPGSEGSVVTDPPGAVRRYTFLQDRVSGISQPPGAGSSACGTAMTYDSFGNFTSRTDFITKKTCYAYDLTRNLETKRVEGLSASAACTPALSSPPPANALVDGKPIAVVCKSTEQATTDDDSGAHGVSAPTTGPARTWRYTYNPFGQMLTSDGPRTDVADTTVYEYYPDTQTDWTMGDLKQVTNAAGHITRFTKYNRHGQVLERIDANGVVTAFTYDLRQRLTSVTEGSEHSLYTTTRWVT